MPDPQELIDLTRQLLDAVAAGDFKAYFRLCDPSLTAFEPEARGQLVEGMQFHRFYFDQLSHRPAINTTMAQPHVRFLGDDVALVCYVRLQQRLSPGGTPQTSRHEETRVWHRVDGQWTHVHFHRSDNGAGHATVPGSVAAP